MTEIYDTQIDFTYASGTSIDQIIGFEMAGVIWSSYLDDDVTVRIHVESTSELPDEVVGAALPGKKKKVDYDKIWDKLSEDITSSNDRLAFDNLPSTEKEFSVIIDGVELDKTKEFRLNNANAKSLGLLKDDSKKLDGYIVVNDLAGNSTVGWDHDALRSNNIGGNEIDFLSVAMHEVGHILGFNSGIDDEGWLKVLAESQEEEKELKDKDFKFATPLDLYRYSNSTASEGKLDLSTGGDPYFSIDGGNNNLGYFANGEYSNLGGDGYQASHWREDSSQGIMNPVLPVGERRNISDLDLTAMDVIGWDLNTSGTQDWSQMYDAAENNAESAVVEDRSKDVEKMIDESKYDGRRRQRSTRVDYYLQIGYWQYTTLDDVDNPEVVVEDGIELETEENSSSVSEQETDESNPDRDSDDLDSDIAEEDSSSVSEQETDESISDSDFDGLDLDSTKNEDITGSSSSYWGEDSLLFESSYIIV